MPGRAAASGAARPGSALADAREGAYLAMRCKAARTIAGRQDIVASSGRVGVSGDEADAIIDRTQATVAGEWDRDVRHHGATTADLAASAPAFENPAFERAIDVPTY